MNIEKFSQTPANKERGIKVFTNPRDLFQDFFNSPQYQNALLDRKKRLAQKWQQTHPKLKFVFTKAQEVESLEVFNRSEEVINLFLKFGQEEVKLNYQAALYPEDAQKLLNTYWELIKTKQQGIEKNDNSGDVFVYENQGKKQFANTLFYYETRSISRRYRICLCPRFFAINLFNSRRHFRFHW